MTYLFYEILTTSLTVLNYIPMICCNGRNYDMCFHWPNLYYLFTHVSLLSIDDPAPQIGTDIDLQLLEAAKAGDMEVVKVGAIVCKWHSMIHKKTQLSEYVFSVLPILNFTIVLIDSSYLKPYIA